MDSLNAPFLKVISEVFCSASINGCVPPSWFLRSHFNSIRRDTMVQKITSLDELWSIPETVRNLVYLSEGGLKFTIFDYRPFDYLITQSAPDDCHFIYLGGESRNVVFGNDTFNRIHGYGGDDILYGGENLDFIFGGSGNDRIRGYDGNDKLHGGHGHDSVHGMEGDDFITGGYGNDILFGHEGDDEIHGGYVMMSYKGVKITTFSMGLTGLTLLPAIAAMILSSAAGEMISFMAMWARISSLRVKGGIRSSSKWEMSCIW
ncbi:MAG: calcium-binding protein [Alphaproteobacteria bacterium]|nr:calcium-binding protein [Alphaproteobacteria bacterium]